MTDRKYSLGRVLEALGAELDVPESKYREAEAHYKAVGDWLGDDDSELAAFEPIIYPQGSFALGTAIRPKGDEDYDVDAVCLLQNLCSHEVSQKELKGLVGSRLLHEKSRYRNMIDPVEGGRRCWTIRYADSSRFHLDVLPAIPAIPNHKDGPILITDRESWDLDPVWPRSDPKGYATWFKDQMAVPLQKARLAKAIELRAEVEQIEIFQVRTPLQRLVQLLKRHRDERFNGDADKPISIIITTLAAHAYDNEEDIVDALLNVVPRMRSHIKSINGEFWIPNPVNPSENFADKWKETPRKAELFFKWLASVETEHQHLLSESGFRNISTHLGNYYGQALADAAVLRSAQSLIDDGATRAAPVILTPAKSTPETSVAHRPTTRVSPRSAKPWGQE